jgi:hypothetical protein
MYAPPPHQRAPLSARQPSSASAERPKRKQTQSVGSETDRPLRHRHPANANANGYAASTKPSSPPSTNHVPMIATVANGQLNLGSARTPTPRATISTSRQSSLANGNGIAGSSVVGIRSLPPLTSASPPSSSTSLASPTAITAAAVPLPPSFVL